MAWASFKGLLVCAERSEICSCIWSLVLQAAIHLSLEAAAMLKPPFIQHLAEQEVQRRQQDDAETH